MPPLPLTTSATGTVKKLLLDEDGCTFTVAKLGADSVFALPRNHANYNALYALLLAASINGYTVTVEVIRQVSDHVGTDWEFVLKSVSVAW